MKYFINKITKGVLIDFEPEHEEISPEDSLSYDETGVDHSEWIDKIHKAYKYSYFVEPEWFCAHIKVTFEDYEHESYLGCCSYNSFKDFEKDTYFEDMINECINNINNEIANENISNLTGYLKRLSSLENSKRKDNLINRIKQKISQQKLSILELF